MKFDFAFVCSDDIFVGVGAVASLMATEDDWQDTSDDLVYEAPLGIQQVDMPDAPTPSGLDKIVSQEDDGPSPHDSSRGPSLSTTTEHLSDANSVHSVPAVLVTEPDSPRQRRPSTLQTPDSHQQPPVSPTRPATQESSLSPSERRNRHRSAVEVGPL